METSPGAAPFLRPDLLLGWCNPAPSGPPSAAHSLPIRNADGDTLICGPLARPEEARVPEGPPPLTGSVNRGARPRPEAP